MDAQFSRLAPLTRPDENMGQLPVAAWCALVRPDVFRSVALMSAPFEGPPDLAPSGRSGDVHAAMAALPRPRKHYQWYYSTRPANDDMWHCRQGVHDFLRACLCIRLAQGYGLTETVGGVSLADRDDLSTGRVGRPLADVRIRLQSWEEGGYTVRDAEGPRGDIVIGCPLVAAGYYADPDDYSKENWVGVVQPPNLDSATVRPKEQSLIDLCLTERAEGRQVWIFCQMTGKRDIQPRLARLLEREGLRVDILRSGTVDQRAEIC